MRKVIFSLLLLGLSTGVFAQGPELYYRVKITTGETGLNKLAAAGVAVDHGDFKKGMYFTSDFSEAELKIIKESGLPYSIEITDVSNYYANRNEGQNSEKPFGAEGCDVCDVYATPLNFQLGTMGGFYKYQEFLNALDSMRSKYPDLITAKEPLSSTLTTIEGRPVYFVKISDNANVSENEPEVMYSAVHHAREAESLSQLIFYMWYLLDNYATNDYVKYLVDHTEMYFVPCLNPDGYIYNETTNPNGGGMWRKNRRNNGNGTFGVDLNRNYDEFWGYDNIGSSPDGSTEVYRGTAGFSEPETQMMRDFCNAHSFQLALNAHTFSNLLIYPWGHIPSFETPDSLAYRHFGRDMASCSGFVVGTGDETVGYVTNGDSDDWMYGEQATKPKIFSMTPEAGKPSDGFWPQLNRIIPIAKQTMDQNLDLVKYATPWAEVVCTGSPFYTLPNQSLFFTFKRTGLSNSNFTVRGRIGSGGSLDPEKHFNMPPHLTTFSDTLIFPPLVGTQLGAEVKYIVKWTNDEGYEHVDTINRYYGTPTIVFSSNCDNLSDFESTAGWGISASAIEGTGSITDSPNGNYTAGSNKSITTLNSIDLTDAAVAFLSFHAKWDIEKSFDDVTVEAAVDGGNFSPLCGRFNHLGNDNQSNRKAIYDGTQQDWVKEYIDLKDYTGKKIKIRFVLHSDQGVEKDGFYFDDMKVEVIGQPVGINDVRQSNIGLQNVPNPCYGNTQIIYNLPEGNNNYYLNVTDATGRIVVNQKLDGQRQSFELNVSKFNSGIYFYSIISDKGDKSEVKKMVVLK